MLRRKLLQNSEAGGGLPAYITLSFKSEYPLGGEDSAWDIDYYYEKLHYQVFNQDYETISEVFTAGMMTDPIFINNGDSLHIEPVNKDNIPSDLTLYADSTMYFFIYDKNGDGVVNSPIGNIKWNTRPGGYDVVFEVGNNAIYSDAYVREDISVPLSRNILLANSLCTVGNGIFIFSVYLYA